MITGCGKEKGGDISVQCVIREDRQGNMAENKDVWERNNIIVIKQILYRITLFVS
jgi:hypothetical protein